MRVHATQPLRPSPAGRVGPGGAGGGYGGPYDVTSLSLSHQSKLTSLHHYNTTDHYAIEWIFSAQNELFKTVLRAVRAAVSRSPHRSVKF